MLALLLSLSAHAGSFAGVTLPDTATLAGQTIHLNGMGLREKYFIDVYVGALYLSHPTHDANTAIMADEPKRVVMHFVLPKVTREQMLASFEEQFAPMAEAVAQRDNINKVEGWVPASLQAGQELAFDYQPGRGTALTLDGKELGVIPGTSFMQLIWSIYLGSHPPTEALKAGLLGN